MRCFCEFFRDLPTLVPQCESILSWGPLFLLSSLLDLHPAVEGLPLPGGPFGQT